MRWYVYILECKDGTFYTGLTSNIERRLKEHSIDNKRGSKYTRGRRPVKLIYQEEFTTRSLALKRELGIKSWGRSKKQKLITTGP